MVGVSEQRDASGEPPESGGRHPFGFDPPAPQPPVSGRMLPVVLIALVGVALAGFVMMPQIVGGWLGPSGDPPWAPSVPAPPSVSADPPPGFAAVPAGGVEVARFEQGSSTVAVLVEPDVVMAGSAQLACAASLREWAGLEGVTGDVERTAPARIGAKVASGVRMDAADHHAVQVCAWLDSGGLISVRGTSSSGAAADLDAAFAAVASGVTLR